MYNNTNIVNNLLPYNFIKKQKKYDIQLLKKKEFDIFYSGKLKYPLLVKETITVNTGKTDPNETPIDRRYLIDPFKEDPLLPINKSFTIQDYRNYMCFGGSLGHNAPAGQHKTSMNIYAETFLLSNITPQDIVLNTGLWALIENWSKFLGKNHNLINITVFTGSVPNDINYTFYDTIMNVPTKMYKLITFQHIDYPNKLFIDCFVCDNKPYNIDYHKQKHSLAQYILPHYKLYSFFKKININLDELLKYYNLDMDNIYPVSSIVNTNIFINQPLVLLMKKSYWFDKMVNVKNIEELEENWKKIQKYQKEFDNLDYHRDYYEYTKKRLEDNITLFKFNKSLKSLQVKQNKKTRYSK